MKAISILLALAAPAASFQPTGSVRARASTRVQYKFGDFGKWLSGMGEKPEPTILTNDDSGFAGCTDAALSMPEAGFEYAPTEEMTGVTVDITRACATMARQIYWVTSEDDKYKDIKWNLSTGDFKCDIVLEDLYHETELGSNIATSPPFAVALTGDTLIASWRGSSTISDWVCIDFGAAPGYSASWYDVAPGLRTHAGFTFMVESDITKHTDDLLALIEKHNVKRLVFTGHSLAGGAAQMANFVVSGRMRQPGSKWAAVADKLEVRNVAFAAPNVMVDVSKSDKKTKSFVADVSSRSCNLIAEQDLVSRVGTDNQFFDAWMTDSIPMLIDDKMGWKPIPNLVYYFADANQKLEDLYDGGKDNAAVQDLLNAISKLRHPAPLVMYKDYKSKPVRLEDVGCDGPKNDPKLFSYSGYDYMKLTDKASATKDPVEREMLEHFLTVECLMYNRGTPEQDLTTWKFKDA